MRFLGWYKYNFKIEQMIESNLLIPNYIFEVSWEVCNKVGGIHTVITSKALTMVNEWRNNIIMIGPDTWKGEGEHPEFVEDKTLFTSWRKHVEDKDLKIKIGRWKITGNPIVILVDFTHYFPEKDEIFRDLWIDYKVDSLTGEWDYIEPALFGYASGKVIECFYHHHLTFSDKIIAQFHEWITGVGLLYLNKNVPQIGTVFTTHATTVGRSIAGNGLPLYSKFESYNADIEARHFNIIAKHSLEKTAAIFADCFTTVSNITAKECLQFLGKKPDEITPNGLEEIIVPDEILFKEKRKLARKKLVEVATSLLGYPIPDETLFILKSGRYEFRNKGIDIYIDSLGELNLKSELQKTLIAFIFVPAHSTGPRKDLLRAMNENIPINQSENKILTHYLQGSESDLILNRIKQNGLENSMENKIKVIFTPVYMNGLDGIYNLNYYDLLAGFDISAFPSYYEPWGYTPLESLAFHIPTITTNLTGFGMIVNSETSNLDKGIFIINRTDNNDKEAISNIASIILEFSQKNENQIKLIRESAFQLSKTALWKKYIIHYKEAYNIALLKANNRSEDFNHEDKVQAISGNGRLNLNQNTTPVWRKLFVQFQLPEGLKKLENIINNIWWTWNYDAEKLFESINSKLWEEYNKNPILMLNSFPLEELQKLEQNSEFISQLNIISEKFEKYLSRPMDSSPQIAYFCMEYGLTSNLKLYSGGLGILAGDYIKQASDSGANFIGIGLLYRNGYFKQEISLHGEQLDQEEVQNFNSLPLFPVYDNEGEWLTISIAFPGRTLFAKIWKIDVGKVPLYLLDADISENQSEDRLITSQLYGGNWENRLKQELLIGIGGIRLLRKLKISPDVYHFNEGHVSFAGIERLLILIQEENLSFEEAIEVVKSSTLFTTHTPVPAGNDVFSEELMRTYLSHHASLFNVNWSLLMALGRVNENDSNEKFSMNFLAARLSQEINAVSRIHENVSRKIFKPLWGGYSMEESHIGHVTNGVHYETWASLELQKLVSNKLAKNEKKDSINWNEIKKIEDKDIWNLHCKQKKSLLEKIKKSIELESTFQFLNVNDLLRHIDTYDENTLIIGFARRFVTYKRSSLLFSNLEKLQSIIKNSKFPILFVFAGKAHPNDKDGQDMIRKIVEISNQKKFSGHVLFLENYDIELAKYLVQGVDVWLNTPEMEMEASGTSGMKAGMNGVLNLSMPDGWWAEGYNQNIGWSLVDSKYRINHDFQNEVDSETLYHILENEVIPMYSERNNENIPVKWVEKMKNSISQITPKFNTERILKEYMEKYYKKLQIQNNRIVKNQYEGAKEIVIWKHTVINSWNNIKVISMDIFDTGYKLLPIGTDLTPHIVLDLNGLSSAEIGVELILTNSIKGEENFNKIIFTTELIPIKSDDHHVIYECKTPINQTGTFEYGFRIFPKNQLLTYRQDFPLLKWI